MRTVFVNGDYLDEDKAKISIFDRGFLFADGVYEVTSVLGGKLIDFAGHSERLARSLKALDMKYDLDADALLAMHRELVARNNIKEGMVYLQITRGTADRDFVFPPADTPNTIVAFTQNQTIINDPRVEKGIKVILMDDLRWGLCDIKTVQLLYPSLAKMEAKKLGADDAWLVRDGKITEGTSNNAYIVTKQGVIVTRELSHEILHGITRKAVLACAKALQMKVEERAFSVEEARDAQEAFITSATSFVMPIVEIEGKAVGSGKPGSVAKKLREIYISESLKRAI